MKEMLYYIFIDFNNMSNRDILQGASISEINKAIVDNYHISWSKLLDVFNYPNPRKNFGIDGFISGIPYMMMNSLFDGDPRMTHQDVKDVIDYFKTHQIPMMWFLSPIGVEYGIHDILDDLGIELATMQVPGMAIDLSQTEQTKLTQLKKKHNIRLIDGIEKSYTEIFMISFEVDPSIEEPMKEFSNEFLKYPDTSHFLAYIDNNPVGCASVIYEAGVAGIYNVGTLPDYRHRGIATSLMASCMLDAIEKGYQYSILHSSEKGKKVYTRLGYEDFFTFKRYLLRPDDVGL